MRFKSILFITSLFLFAHAAANNNFSIKTVVIDAGHGGKDPGASGPGRTREKDLALAVALKLGENITKNFPDVNVIYTRKTDVFLELHERAEIANRAKADLFIAVHINSSPNSEFYGTSTYVLGLHRTEANLDVAKRENAVILLEEDRDKNYEFDPNSPEGHIIMSMKQNAFLDQSIALASKVENQFENFSKRKSMGVKQAGFYVLYKTTMPSLLTELGFISNPEEEKYLQSAKGQEQIASALLNAFREYKTEMEGTTEVKPVAEQKEESKEVKKEVKPEVKAETKAEPKIEAKAETKTETKAETKTEVPVVKTDTEPVKATTNTNPDFITVKSGMNIHKPIELSSGGGKATAAVQEPVKKPEPVVKKEEPKPVAEIKAETKEEVKPVVKTESKAVKEETKPVVKTEKEEVKPVVKAETKAEKEEVKPVTKEEPKAEKEEVKPVVKAEPKPVMAEKKPEPKAETNKPVVESTPKAGSTVVFKVQLFALKSEVKASEYSKVEKLFSSVSKETLPNGITRYYGGNEKTYTGIKKILAVAKSSGYPDAYIVGFKDGNRMGAEQMKAFEQ